VSWLVICYLLIFVPLTDSRAQLKAQFSAQTNIFPKDKTVIDLTVAELRQYCPSELLNLSPNPDQDELNPLLVRIGERVGAFFRLFSNTACREDLLMQRLGYNGGVEDWNIRYFNYLMFYSPGESLPSLEEYRTDRENRPIGQDATEGFYVTSGYVCHNLHFHPGFQHASDFRYLGRQISGSRAHIIAFAQKLNQEGLRIGFTDIYTGESTRLPVQGIACIDADTYQILRLYINLLPAGNSSSLKEQTTDIKFSETQFENAKKRLWMPQEITIITTIGGIVFRNYHRYSEYKLFTIESDTKFDRPKPRN